jgi:hypothetical protein
MIYDAAKRTASWLPMLAMFFIAVAVGAVGATPASAQTAHTEQIVKSKNKKSGKVQTAAPNRGNQQRAEIDPQTGRLKEPTAEDSRELNDEMSKKHNRNPEELVVTQQADGTLMVQLGEEYMDVMVVKIGQDGKPVMDCVKGVSNAEAVVKAEANAANAIVTSSAKPAEAGSAKVKPAAKTADSKTESAAKPAPVTGRKE